MTGLTFDTGALIALERRRQRMAQIYRTAVMDGLVVTVPSAVITEWWRGRTDAREIIRRGVRVESLDDELAKLAGDALAAVANATAIDPLRIRLRDRLAACTSARDTRHRSAAPIR